MSDARDEIRACIAFYDERGADWTSVVGYLACKALDCLPHDVLARAFRARSQKRRHAKAGTEGGSR